MMGLNFLYSKDIFHLNLKPENILIDDNGNGILSLFIIINIINIINKYK
jgi:serine/threonine protein kinase